MIRNKVVSVVSVPPSATQLDPMRHLGISLVLALAVTCSDSIAASANESLQRCPTALNYRSAMPEMIPPETDSDPTGWADVALTISAAGTVTDATVIEWRISPNKSWIRDWFLSGVRNLKFDGSQTTRRCSLHYKFSLSADLRLGGGQ